MSKEVVLRAGEVVIAGVGAPLSSWPAPVETSTIEPASSQVHRFAILTDQDPLWKIKIREYRAVKRVEAQTAKYITLPYTHTNEESDENKGGEGYNGSWRSGGQKQRRTLLTSGHRCKLR